MAEQFQVLGYHGAGVPTVEGNKARVRMFIGGAVIDEDFDIPVPPTVEDLLREAVKARIQRLEQEQANG